MKNHHKVIIIGSGPAGLTAALYTGRANLEPLVFEGIQPGGQLTITTEVENYPGFPDGVLGPDMMDIFRKQALKFNARNLFQDVTKVDFSDKLFRIYSQAEEFTADAVIIATGASAKWLGVPGEEEFRGHGVSACATCDAFFFRGLDVVVVGGGDTAMEEASFLAKFASHVIVIHRRDKLRASKIMQDRILKNPKVSFAWDSEVTEILGKKENGKKSVVGVRVKNVKNGQLSVISANGFFVAIGHQPNTSLFAGQMELDSAEYIVTRPGRAATSVPGVFAAGDVADPVYRQAVTAAGTGCMAAIEVERYLETLHS